MSFVSIKNTPSNLREFETKYFPFLFHEYIFFNANVILVFNVPSRAAGITTFQM